VGLGLVIGPRIAGGGMLDLGFEVDRMKPSSEPAGAREATREERLMSYQYISGQVRLDATHSSTSRGPLVDERGRVAAKESASHKSAVSNN